MMEGQESNNDDDHGIMLFPSFEEDRVPQSEESSTEVCKPGAFRGVLGQLGAVSDAGTLFS
jgi:hypothetical protein